MDTRTRFAKRLRSARARLGLSQAEAAKLAKMDQSRLSHFENGNRSPSIENLSKIARALNVSADYLLGLSSSLEPGGFRSELSGLTRRNREMVLSIIECIAEHTQSPPSAATDATHDLHAAAARSTRSDG